VEDHRTPIARSCFLPLGALARGLQRHAFELRQDTLRTISWLMVLAAGHVTDRRPVRRIVIAPNRRLRVDGRVL